MNSLLEKMQGLKFPDEMVTRFFFKNSLHKRPGRVLELGCGNGNNLGLFAAYGWKCMGIDYASELIAQGHFNFQIQGYPQPRLEVSDMNDPLPNFGLFDVLLMPGSLYYVHALRAKQIISELSANLSKGGYVFCRFRTPEDYRFGKGIDLGYNSYKIQITETSEYGSVNAFYDLETMLSVLKPCDIDPNSLRVMRLYFDNLGLEEKMIDNKEIVLWGSRN